MSRVVLIGIDGMDYGLVNAYADELANLTALSKKGIGTILESVFPADSIPSWITIFTGLGPEEHGIIRSIDYLSKNYKKFSVNTDTFREKTFWDTVGKHGKKVCIVNPFMAYPVWPVLGTMISGAAFTTGSAQCYPEETLSKYGLPDGILGGIADFPTKKTLDEFVKKCRSETTRLADYSLKIFKEEDWDLFFVTFLTLDRVEHFLWRYMDKNDPTYPGSNRYQNVVKSFYKLFDEIIGAYLAGISEEDCLIVISDHGHGMRCTKHLNLNEYFRQKGYLKPAVGKIACLSKKYWIEKAKHLFLQTLFSLDLEDLTYFISRFIPNRDKLKTSKFVINSDESLVSLSDFAGSGPYGGINIRDNARAGSNYETIREKIIEDLQSLNSKYDGKLFKWVKRREEKFSTASHVDAYPDIVFELYDPYGVSWGLFVSLISRNPFHKKISGGHNPSGIIFSNSSLLKNRNDFHVHDIKSIVLEGLGLNGD